MGFACKTRGLEEAENSGENKYRIGYGERHDCRKFSNLFDQEFAVAVVQIGRDLSPVIGAVWRNL